MRVVVTGGTGFIGRALVSALRERGDEPIVVSRQPAAAAVGWDDLDAEVERSDAVVHLAGEPIAAGRWTAERMRRIRDSRIEPTERVVRAVARAAGRRRVLVSASAVGIYGMRTDDRVLDEDAEPGVDVLARLVVDWERAADPARAAGARVVHPRTGIVLGRGGGALPRMALPYRFFAGGPLGDGRQWVSWIHLRDAVRALLFAVDHDALSGPFNVVGPEPVTMSTLSRAIGAALDRPAVLHVPRFVVRAALGRGLAEALLTGQRAVPRALARAGFVFDFETVVAACADLLGPAGTAGALSHGKP